MEEILNSSVRIFHFPRGEEKILPKYHLILPKFYSFPPEEFPISSEEI